MPQVSAIRWPMPRSTGHCNNLSFKISHDSLVILLCERIDETLDKQHANMIQNQASGELGGGLMIYLILGWDRLSTHQLTYVWGSGLLL